MDLSSLSSWVWIILGLLLAFVFIRYFLHIIVGALHLVLGFFWHGCIAVIVLFAIYVALHAMHVI
jgi:hypothetical protein